MGGVNDVRDMAEDDRLAYNTGAWSPCNSPVSSAADRSFWQRAESAVDQPDEGLTFPAIPDLTPTWTHTHTHQNESLSMSKASLRMVVFEK